LRGVFNPDSPMMRALGVVWDLIVLNLLFLVCCIPVVTIGPAITALHYVTTKMAGEKKGSGKGPRHPRRTGRQRTP